MSPTKWNALGTKPRHLTADEMRIIEFIAENVSEYEKRGILDDARKLSVQATEDGTLLEFDIEGYERPPYTGQHDFDIDVDICVDDLDGAHISIILFADQNDRLLELEYIRWDFKEIRDPQWETLRIAPLIKAPSK